MGIVGRAVQLIISAFPQTMELHSLPVDCCIGGTSEGMLYLTAHTYGCNLIKQSSSAVEDPLLKAFMLELDTAPKPFLHNKPINQQTD